MSRTQWRWLIAVFWIVVIGMLLKQCWVEQQQQATTDSEAPKPPQHFFFIPQPVPHALPSAPTPTLGPAVLQTKFVVHPDSPGRGMFTCDVTLTNEGETIAHGVQIYVRPYRGIYEGNDSLGGGHTPKFQKLPDDDPLSQFGTWLNFPDLKPGETAMESTTFLNHPNVLPGLNPNPQINFEAPKP